LAFYCGSRTSLTSTRIILILCREEELSKQITPNQHDSKLEIKGKNNI